MESDCFIQYPKRSVEKSQVEPEVVDGEIRGHSSCYQECPLEFAAAKQAIDNPRMTHDPGVGITKEPAIESRHIEYSRHYTNIRSWESAHRGKLLVPGETKADSRRIEYGRHVTRHDWKSGKPARWSNPESSQGKDLMVVQPKPKILSAGRSFHTGRTAGAMYRPPHIPKLEELD